MNYEYMLYNERFLSILFSFVCVVISIYLSCFLVVLFSTFTKLFPLLSGIVMAPHMRQRPLANAYKRHVPPIPIKSKNVGNILMETHPDKRNKDWVIPIDKVLISVGNISFINMCNTGIIPTPLVMIKVPIKTKGIQLNFSSSSFPPSYSFKKEYTQIAIMDNTEIDWQITNIILGLTFPTMNGIIPRRIVISKKYSF